MSLLNDTKYISLISNRLDRFKRLKPELYRFRCPLCGDSKKDKNKTRGFILPNKKRNGYIMKCHNCGDSISVGMLIKYLDPILYDEYRLEAFGKHHRESKTTVLHIATPKFKQRSTFFDDLIPVADYDESHPVRQYLANRHITKLHRFFIAPRFKKWTNSIVPGKFSNTYYEEPRLVIPFYDETGVVFAYQGRSLDPKEKQFKYLTVSLDENRQRIYGLDTVDKSKTVYVVEGPIDSMFIDNGVAAAGSDLDSVAKTLFENCVYVFDNEPRNRQIVEKIQRLVNENLSVVIWNENIPHGLDINDMIKRGIDVNDIIHRCTYSGLKAKLEFERWTKL